MRIMAVDFGDAHTGIAVSDPTGMITGSAWVIDERNFDAAAEKIAAAASESSAERIVLGCPRNMDGTLGPRAEKSMLLAERLRELTSLEVALWDERRTTVDAHRILSDVGKRGKKRKKTVDAVAASLILEGYLGSIR
ncbi:MAG: Holliday junction resolvase RuvX [Oscillospiraceae bacterium]|nr:Holliday junction resolvase RuvX [Oscillospiraceae bacterium]